MSLSVCFPDLHAQGKISDSRFEEWRPRYEGLVAEYERLHGRAAAESMATERVLELMESAALEKKRQSLLQVQAQQRVLANMREDADEDGIFNTNRVAQFFVEMDNHRRAVSQQAKQMIGAILEKHRRNLRGKVRDLADLDNMRREVFGEDTGNATAKEFARAWKETAEWLRSRFNAAGGHIAKLDSWAFPQRHDMRQIREVGQQEWIDYLLRGGPDGRGMLNREAMIDRETGLPMTDAKLELDILPAMYAAITSDGWTRNTPGTYRVGAKGNQRAEHRVLHFRDADTWQAYADRFGGGTNVFDAMISHIESMALDIAAMERMGPNPNATLRFMQDSVEENRQMALARGWRPKASKAQQLTNADMGQVAMDDAKAARANMQNLFDTFTGEANKPVRKRLAMGFSIYRSQQTAAKLGGAVLSVGGDFGLMKLNAQYNGIPARKVMTRYLALMNPANAADRAQAARHVLMFDQWSDSHAAQWRTLGEELAHEGARNVASGVLRLSGLTAHTDMARTAFAMEMTSHITHMRDRSFGQLDGATQRLLQRYDIGEAEWDRLRAIQPESYKETDWLYPQTVAASGEQRLADNYMRMLTAEADFAVPVPDLRTRALIGRARKGTWAGEVIRSTFLFKGFPLTVMNLHGRRMLDEGASRGQVAGMAAQALIWRYGLKLALYTTLGGALSLQVKELARGKDPMAMDNKRFWTAALVQGGGVGIIGDFLFTDTNRFGGSSAETFVGPTGQVFDNLKAMTWDNVANRFDDDPNNDDYWKRALSRTVMSETPGMSLWYSRLLIERTLRDIMEEWAYGDGYDRRLRDLERYAEDRGTSYWAPPGGGFDWRAPNFGNALGQSEDSAIEDVQLPSD